MKLTTEQVSLIEETLVLNGLKYDDIKLEVTDHIASEIEVLMDENGLSFEENLHSILESWKEQLRPSSNNLLLGYSFSAPKIIINKMVIDKKKELFIAVIIVSILTVAIFIINNKIQNPSFLSNVVFFLKTTSILGAFFMISAKLILLKSKIKTTYLFMFNRNFYLILLFGLLIGFGFFPILPSNKNTEIKIVSLMTTLMYLFSIYNSLNIFFKHFQFEKKYSISN